MSVEAPGGTEVRGPTVDVGRTQALGVDAWAAVAGLRLTRAAIVAFAVTHAARAALALVASEVELSASPWWSRLGDAISVTTFATGVVAGATIVLLALWWFDAARAGNPVGRRRGTVEHLAGRAAVTTALGALALGSVSAASSSIAAVAAAAAGLTVVQALAGLVAAVTAAEVRWAEQACRVAAAVRQR